MSARMPGWPRGWATRRRGCRGGSRSIPCITSIPFGTLLFPALMIFGPLLSGGAMGGFLFGWAKPTPVITRNFKKIVRDDTLTTLAGPVSNLLLALVGISWGWR